MGSAIVYTPQARIYTDLYLINISITLKVLMYFRIIMDYT